MGKKDKSNMNPYELDKLSKVPKWLVIFFLKYWAASAAIFFIVIGGLDIGLDFSTEDMTDPLATLVTTIKLVFIIALGLAFFMNYLVKQIVFLVNNSRNNVLKYNMVNLKGIKALFVSFAYYLVISIILFFVTLFLGEHKLIIDLFGTAGGSGIEPFTYGLCFIIVDGVFLIIKGIIVYQYRKHKYYKLIKEN